MIRKVLINTEYITLGQLLKFENIVDSGGLVKTFLSENEIKVNNIIDNRRGRKLYNGDIVEIKRFGTYEVKRNENK